MLSVIVPVYNEEKNIDKFVDTTVPILEKLGNYEIIFCLDPSNDDTEKKIKKRIELDKSIKLIKLSRRFGQSNSILAGIENCLGDYSVIIDVDLQDPPELIYQMYHKAKEGYDCVYAERTKKVGENFLRLLIINIYYFIINKLSEVPIPKNVGEYRLISRRMIEYIKIHGSYNFYLRGVTSLIGFKSAKIKFIRKSREVGVSKYLIGSFKDATNGVLNFTSLAKSLTLLLVFINTFVSLSFFFI
jgi:dolichol-phosphate mannosyltransferase